MQKIYLDNCCFNRPYDDQNQFFIKIETDAKLRIQDSIKQNEYTLIWSFILDYENNFNTPDKSKSISKWKELAKISIKSNNEIITIAREIIKTGIKNKDALHLASAIHAQADFFLTVDNRVLKYKDNRILILNPIEFIEREGYHE